MKNDQLKSIIQDLGLTDYQTEKLIREVKDILNLNEKNKCKKPIECPNCTDSDPKFIKKGINSGKQRYQCKSCESVFVWDINRLTYNSRVQQDKWNILIQDTLSLEPLLVTARKTDLSERTIFRMRHKFLLLLEKLISTSELDGVIECDETFVLESRKGTKPNDRKSRKRRGCASKRGLSDEQICVVVATNRQGAEFASVIDTGKPSADAITRGLDHHISEGSVMITDHLTSYNDLVESKKCKHYTLSDYTQYNKLLHMNTVNSIHSIFKGMIRQFRGVATKYLNRYCALLIFVREFAQMDDNEMMSLMRDKIRNVDIFCKIDKINYTDLVLV